MVGDELRGRERRPLHIMTSGISAAPSSQCKRALSVISALVFVLCRPSNCFVAHALGLAERGLIVAYQRAFDRAQRSTKAHVVCS